MNNKRRIRYRFFLNCFYNQGLIKSISVRLFLSFIIISSSCNLAYAGNLFVADPVGSANGIQEFDAATGASVGAFGDTAANLTAPHALAFHPTTGNLFVADQVGSANGIQEFDAATGAFIGSFGDTANQVDNPVALGFHPVTGNLFVAGSNDGDIREFDGNTGAFIGVFGNTAATLAHPQALAFHPATGNLFVTGANSEFNTDVQVFDGATGASLGGFGGTEAYLIDPVGLAFHPATGNLFVTDSLDGDVKVFDGATGASLGSFGDTANTLTRPAGLAFDPATKNLFVLDSTSGDIQVFDGVTGASLGAFGDTEAYLVDPQFLVFQPDTVPVPDIKANGSDGPVTILKSETLKVAVSLDSGDFTGVAVDWWVAADTPFGWFYFDAITFEWVSIGASLADLRVTHQGPLFDLSPIEVLNMPLPVGTYTFYFALDGKMNGLLDFDGPLVFDSVSVNVISSDPKPPTVNITSPTNGTTVSGIVPVSATASDNVAVDRVEFFVDGVLEAIDTTNSYGFSLDTESMTAGDHTIQAKAFDTSENSASDTITVKVNNGLAVGSIGDQTVDLGNTLSFTVTVGDPDNDTLSVTPLPLPDNVSFNSATGLFTFTPDETQVGSFQLTFTESGGPLMNSETINITVLGAAPDGITALSGQILDANDASLGITTPIVGATVTNIETGLSTNTDTNGNFILSGLTPGENHFDYDGSTAAAKDGLSYGAYRGKKTLIAKVTNVITRPIYIMKVDIAGEVLIDPDNTTVLNNPSLGITLTIPPNTVKNADGSFFTGMLSISEVPVGFTPASLPSTLNPAMVITIQPMGLTFAQPAPIVFPNIDNLAPGSQVDLWSLDHALGKFFIAGTGEVSSDGSVINTIDGGIREASWHLFIPPGTESEEEKTDCGCKTKECKTVLGSEAAVDSGELTVDHTLAGYRSLSRSRALRFVYNSDTAHPQPVINNNVTNSIRADVPLFISSSLSVAGVDQGVEIFTDTSGLNQGADDTILKAMQFDASALETGIYPYRITNTSHFAISSIGGVSGGNLNVNNQSNSPFGAGWTLDGLARLNILDTEDIQIIEGDGSSLVFQSVLQATKRPMPTARQALTSSVVNGKIYAIGGREVQGDSGNQDLTTVEEYDPSTDTWSTKTSMPTARSFLTSSVVNGKIYVIGGFSGQVYRTVEEYDPSTDTWTTKTSMPTARSSLTSSVVNGKIYVIGGWTGFGPLATVEEYDPSTDTWTTKTSLPTARGLLTSSVVNGKIYVIGGWAGSRLALVEEYDPSTDTWTTKTSMPTARNFLTSSVVNGKIYAIGGREIVDHSATIEEYDPFTDTWTTRTSISIARKRLTSSVVNGKIYVIGGNDENNVFATVEEYDPSTDSSLTRGFVSPTGDFSTLDKNEDGSFTRTMKDGTKINFDANGLQTSVVDRNGNTTTYAYDGGDNLTSITDPVGLVTTLAYSGDKLSGVTGPAGRTTNFAHDGGGGNLTGITDPDGNSRQFGYDSHHHLTSQTSKRGFVTNYQYDTFGKMTQSSLPDGSTRMITPSESAGLVDLASGLGSKNNPAPVVRPEDVVAVSFDGNGNKTTFKTDPFGAANMTTDALGRTTSTTRDENSNPTQTTGPNGAITRMTYDDRGNMLTLKEAVGDSLERQTSFEYEPDFNQITKRTDPAGKVTTFEYDAQGNLIKTTDPLGNENTFTYDTKGLLLTSTDAKGNTTTFSYNANGNVITATDASGNITNFSRDNAGNIVSSTEGAGAPEERASSFTYDNLNRILTIVDGTGATTKLSYDSAGNVEKIENPTGEIITMSYDESDRAISIDNPISGITQLTYDLNGNLVTSTDALGNAATNEYDAANQLTKSTDALGGDTILGYDAQGNIISFKDALGQTTTFAYDLLVRQIKRTNPLGLNNSSTYDSRDNIITGTDQKGQVTTNSYDDLSRLTESRTPDNTISFLYDAVSNLVAIQDNDSSLAFVYDNLNRVLTSEVIDVGVQPGVTLTNSYDSLSNRTQLTDTAGGTTQFSYDPANRLTKLITPAGDAINLTNDLAGRLTQIAFPNGVVSNLIYDVKGRLENLTHKDGGGANLASFGYTYNEVGNILSIAELTKTRQFTYDALQRLISGGAAGSPETYSYDALGNRVTSHLSSAHNHDAANRLLEDDDFTYTYDNNGNLSTKTAKSGGGTTTYTWNAHNQLTQIDFPDATNATYRYDALGRRIEKNVNGAITRYVYDGLHILTEYDGTNTLAVRYNNGDRIDQPLSMERGGQNYFYHTDHLGSIHKITDSGGTAFNTYDYDSYGRLENNVEGVPNPFFYTGRELDVESGLYFYRARYYDPLTGRFINEDPIGFLGGDSNLLAYVKNNPVNTNDPIGLATPAEIALLQRISTEAVARLVATDIGASLATIEAFELTAAGGAATTGGFLAVPTVAAAGTAAAIGVVLAAIIVSPWAYSAYKASEGAELSEKQAALSQLRLDVFRAQRDPCVSRADKRRLRRVENLLNLAISEGGELGEKRGRRIERLLNTVRRNSTR